MQLTELTWLRLLQLADSALPIGAIAHSFGLETLVADEDLDVPHLSSFLQEYLAEAGTLESIFCRRGYHLVTLTPPDTFEEQWLALNARLSALKTARESRVASATLGRRFLQLVQTLEELPLLQKALQASKAARADIHYSVAFGLISGLLAVDETASVLAYLQQSILGLVYACQRLMPLGQSQASKIVWQLKPVLITIAERSEAAAQSPEDTAVFTPLLDIGSMRHSTLPTRLFIS